MLFDSHVHTIHSCDADTTLAQAITAASTKNIGLVITDHMELDFPIPPPDFRLDVPHFFAECSPLRSDKLLLGIELGMTERNMAANNDLVQAHDFDFVLGSVHVLHGREVDEDLYAGMDEAAVYHEYLNKCAHLVLSADIDALGHIDYPLRSTSRELLYADYREDFNILFDALLARNILLELNTSRLCDPVAYANLLVIYRAYKARGGRYVTLGSDAHEPHEIADNFALATELLQAAGLIPVYFVRRQMVIDHP